MLLCLVLCCTSLNACRSGDSLPDPSSQTYREAVAAFYTGLAAIQAGVEVIAEEKMLRVTELVPQEPAAWANLGLLALRRTAFDLAAARLHKARTLAPQSSQIQVLSGLLESMQGRLDTARAYLQRAVALEPRNLKAVYALAQLTRTARRRAERRRGAALTHTAAHSATRQPCRVARTGPRGRQTRRHADAAGHRRTPRGQRQPPGHL